MSVGVELSVELGVEAGGAASATLRRRRERDATVYTA
ncbi:MAG: hypothetical protein QOH44_941, partial [Actinomycetota bacterium]|nr:hypothetical protein [Actinomycetota bacterium]